MKIKHTAYLLLEIVPPTYQEEVTQGRHKFPTIKSVRITSQAGTQMSLGYWATFLQADADTYQEAKDRVLEVVRRSFPWLLFWVEEGMDAHMRRYCPPAPSRLHEVVSPLASAAGVISNMLDGTTEPNAERLSRVQDAIDRAIKAARAAVDVLGV